MQDNTGMEEGSMASQLTVLYAEREYLHEHLGISESAYIVAMVRSLETQLSDLYKEKEEAE